MGYVLHLQNVDLIYKTTESLSIKNLVSFFLGKKGSPVIRQFKALNNVSLQFMRGKVYGVIGNNGAGKSTLLRVLSGVISPNKGTIKRYYSTINLLAMGIGFSAELKGIENIYLNGMILGFSRKRINEVLDDIIEYSELGEFIYRPMKTYSTGMISRLGFSIAIHLNSEVLLIDEILSVGDTRFRDKSYSSIKKVIKDKNRTVILVSHNMRQISDLCDEVIWLDKGEIVAQGNPANILKHHMQYVKGNRSVSEIRSLFQ